MNWEWREPCCFFLSLLHFGLNWDSREPAMEGGQSNLILKRPGGQSIRWQGDLYIFGICNFSIVLLCFYGICNFSGSAIFSPLSMAMEILMVRLFIFTDFFRFVSCFLDESASFTDFFRFVSCIASLTALI